MGLDMYLCRQNENEEDMLLTIGFWRKANHIHKWFCDHCNNGNEINCFPVEVSLEQLKELYDVCTRALRAETASEKMAILPTCEGFFFGSQEYDEEYDDGLRETMEIIDDAIWFTDFETQTIYYDAWW